MGRSVLASGARLAAQEREIRGARERTADELGRAFPDTRVIVADGAHPVLRVDGTPALVWVAYLAGAVGGGAAIELTGGRVAVAAVLFVVAAVALSVARRPAA